MENSPDVSTYHTPGVGIIDILIGSAGVATNPPQGCSLNKIYGKIIFVKKEVLPNNKPTTEKRVSQFELVGHLLNAGYTSIFSKELSQGWVAYVSERSIKMHGVKITRCYVVDEDGMVGWSHISQSDHHKIDPLESAIANLRSRQMRLETLIDVDDQARYRRKKQGKCIQSLQRQQQSS